MTENRPAGGGENLVKHGIGEIDDQHLAILTLVRRATQAIRGDSPSATVRTHLDDLRDAVRSHFVSEETLMRLLLYPGLPEHAAMHGRMLERLDALSPYSARGGLESLGQIDAWFADHFRESDRHYIEFLEAHGQSGLPSRGLFEKL